MPPRPSCSPTSYLGNGGQDVRAGNAGWPASAVSAVPPTSGSELLMRRAPLPYEPDPRLDRAPLRRLVPLQLGNHCSNVPAVIRSIVIASVLFVVSCAKVDDLGRLQEEGTQTAKSYLPKVDELQHRADAALGRGAEAARGSDPNETVRARALLDRASQLISELRAKATTAPADIASTAKSGSFEDVERKLDELRHHMKHGMVEANGDLDAVEGWLAQAETQAKTNPMPAEPTETEPNGEPPSDEANAPAKQPEPKQPEPKQPKQPEPKPEPKQPAAKPPVTPKPPAKP